MGMPRRGRPRCRVPTQPENVNASAGLRSLLCLTTSFSKNEAHGNTAKSGRDRAPICATEGRGVMASPSMNERRGQTLDVLVHEIHFGSYLAEHPRACPEQGGIVTAPSPEEQRDVGRVSLDSLIPAPPRADSLANRLLLLIGELSAREVGPDE